MESAGMENNGTQQELGNEIYSDDQAKYFPPELVSHCVNDSMNLYHCYLIQLRRNFDYDVPLHDIVFALRTELELDDENMTIDLEVDRGSLTVHVKYVGVVELNSEQVLLCQQFQVAIFRVLLDGNLKELNGVLEASYLRNEFPLCDYLLLPFTGSHHNPPFIDWKCVSSVQFPHQALDKSHTNCSLPKGYARLVKTKNGSVCSCMLENSLVCTPHNDHVYCITGTLNNLDGNTILSRKNGQVITYKKHFKSRHGIDLCFESESLLNGRHIFPVQNCLWKCRQQKEKDPSNASVELPPELCSVLMSPISIATFYSFSFVPSIMHRIESLLIALNLKKMLVDHCMQNVVIPTFKVLEAITTKECQENFHCKSLATIGDSFLKYAACQQLFKTYQNHHESLLTARKEKIISNPALCKLGCDCKLPGFIRNELFDPKMWIIPGDRSRYYALDEELVSTKRKVYNRGIRKVKSKRVADVVEALIGAYLITGGELAALSLMDWLGIKVDFVNVPYQRDFPVQPEKLVNIRDLESLLNYSFRDPSLLVEALTHGSCIRPEIPRCYKRLEFLGDSVLDYLITMHLCHEYPELSPGLITDLRSASVNNECYALSSVKAGLHIHILHDSQDVHKRIISTVNNFEQLSLESTSGWQQETTFPKVLGDIIESVAGAILIDSGYNKEIVFQSIRPLLEPLITPETVPLNPVKELNDLCLNKKMTFLSRENGTTCVTIEVEANGITHNHSSTAANKKMAKKLASKAVLKSLKESMSGT
ncbi:endoribonuclease Dicer homolog 2-like [Cornus florida]|uniref:endoribonuclease Dicer homolog 2-like n=1 Tax=Cornus florida TaxID=4283 RepID=UPI002897919D|nr:endoribonuclease Dicer homolog 2-like [Cornus florida]